MPIVKDVQDAPESCEKLLVLALGTLKGATLTLPFTFFLLLTIIISLDQFLHNISCELTVCT